MEPSSYPYGWGRFAWSFLHGMTLDPTNDEDTNRAQLDIL